MTDPRWLEAALEDFDAVLADHAHAEKKAAAQAMALVGAYPDRDLLVRRLSALALEELRHFRSVYEHLRARGLSLGRDPGDPYAQALMRLVRVGRPEDRLVDRLLVPGLIEARSAERLSLLADALPDPQLCDFYRSLAKAELGHADLFRQLAEDAVPADRVAQRLGELASAEAGILRDLPIEARIH